MDRKFNKGDIVQHFKREKMTDLSIYEDEVKKYLEEFMNKMEYIQYGWIDINNKIHIKTIENIKSLYRLASIDEINEYKVGICFDQVEYERFYFNDRFETHSYAIFSAHMMHAFLALKSDIGYIYFEHSSSKSRGIYYFKSMELLLKFAVDQYMIRHGIKDKSKVKLVPYDRLPDKITFKGIKELIM